MSRTIDPAKSYDELSDDERAYLDARTWLKAAHAEAHRQHEAASEDGGTDTPAEPVPAEEEEAAELTPEEWVAQASKAEITAELDRREIEYNSRDSKAVLGRLLLENI